MLGAGQARLTVQGCIRAPDDERAVCYILAGGPSLAGFDCERLRGHGFVIAVNNSLRLAPWADLLYFADCCWLLDGHLDEVRSFAGVKLTREPACLDYHVPDLKLIDRAAYCALSNDPRALAGLDSGANAVNLAYLLGFRQIVLMGFDMRPNGHWHKGHTNPQPAKMFERDYRPSMVRMLGALAERRVTVLLASPGSALEGECASVALDALPLP